MAYFLILPPNGEALYFTLRFMHSFIRAKSSWHADVGISLTLLHQIVCTSIRLPDLQDHRHRHLGGKCPDYMPLLPNYLWLKVLFPELMQISEKTDISVYARLPQIKVSMIKVLEILSFSILLCALRARCHLRD